MPRTKSAVKALRQSARRRVQNLVRKKELKETIKKFRGFVASGKTDEAKSHLPQVYKKIDKLAKIGFLKRNTANRMKSRLARRLGK